MVNSTKLARVKRLESVIEARGNVLKMPVVLNVDLDEWEQQSLAYHTDNTIGFYADAARWNDGK